MSSNILAPKRARNVVDCDDCNDTLACKRHVGARVRCGRCLGTGKFVTQIVDGDPVGPGDPCFRCNGKGFHTRADRSRNRGHELFRTRGELRYD